MLISKKNGFTLLELLISITLTAVIVTMLSISLRTAVRTYTKGKAINMRLLKIASLENLLGRQLRAASGFDLNELLFIKGENKSLSFVTPFAPFGSSRQGLFKACYLFDESTESVIYMQRLVTTQNDINIECAANIENDEGITEDGWEYSVLRGVKTFSLFYLAVPKSENAITDPGNWNELWENAREMPHLIRLEWEFAGEQADENDERVIASSRIFINNPLIFFDIL